MIRWTLRWLEHGEAQTREAVGFQLQGGNPRGIQQLVFNNWFEFINYGENWEWTMAGCEFFPMVLETTFHWFLTREGGENSGSLESIVESNFSWEVEWLQKQLHAERSQSDVRQQKLLVLETGHQSRDAEMLVKSGWLGFSEYLDQDVPGAEDLVQGLHNI